MKPTEKSGINGRIYWVGAFFVCLFLVIIGKTVHLQVFQGQWLSRLAAGEYEKTLTIRGKRGTIFDRNLREMAVSVDAASIAAYPRHIKKPGAVATALSEILNLNRAALLRKITSDRTFVWIKRQSSPSEERAIRALGFKGFDFIPEHTRYYPNRYLAAQLLGFTGVDSRGLEGLEYYFNEELTGTERSFTVLKDALGKKFDGDNTVEGVYRGNDLVLTIDRTIQFITEKALGEAVADFNAKSGLAVVMAPKTGAILAMANFPLFNPNAFKRYDRELWRNRIITDPFEPGSTMKIFSAAAAIESGGCTPNTIFYCENGKYRIGREVVHDTRSHGWLSLNMIIKYSSNIGAVKVSEMIGAEALHRTLRSFGFGEKTGLTCPAETSGSLSPYQRWSRIDTGVISFGHGMSVSALQLVTAAAAIANGGLLMKPYVVQEIRGRDGEPIQQYHPREVRQAVSPQTAETVKKMMASVVEPEGTGVRAALDGYTVCGKTGTAQKLNEAGEYTRDAYVGSFVGFVPAEDPQIAILVVIDELPYGSYGGTVAAPTFQKIARETLNYLNIPAGPGGDRITAGRQGGEVNG